ncbi:MAG: hypothetical protein NZ772_03180 [Cyanobacteria bacterium]|nr:hypothetical protein [Cyanobacteriota bacterium]MDW8200025.1 hypothetical protein [Cyanobacteriota bacterium SKYGB_h_bin112]
MDKPTSNFLELPSRFRRSWAPLAAFLVSAIAIAGFQFPTLSQLRKTQPKLSLTEIQRQLEGEQIYLAVMKKLPSFGMDNMIANWTFLKFLQYFGDDDARNATDYQLSPDYFEVILSRDPRFLQAYVFLSGSTSLYAGRPDRTIAIMNQGLRFVTPKVPPYSFYIWRYKGTDELLFLGDPLAAQTSFSTAAVWAESYTDAESQQVAALSRRTARFLARNPNSKNAQVSAWSIVLGNVADRKTRDYAIRKIRELGGDVVETPQGLQVIPPNND